MKTVKFFLGAMALAAVSMIAAPAINAQEDGNRDENGKVVRGPYLTNRFVDNWFVGVAGGVNLLYDRNFGYAPALAIDANDEDYKGDNGEDGYNTGKKISVSSGNESTASACVSGFIKLPEGEQSEIRINNITLSASASINNFVFYNANKEKISGYYAGSGAAGSFHSDVSVTDGVYLFPTERWFPNDNIPVYFRFSCGEITDKTIVTINEEIV